MWRMRLRRNRGGGGSDDSRDDDENRPYREQLLEAQRVIEQRRADSELLNGTYYATLGQVWSGKEAEFGDVQHFTNLVRSAPPTFIPRSRAVAGGDGNDDDDDDDDVPIRGDPGNAANKRAVYAWTKECAEDSGRYEAAATHTAPSRGRSSRSSRNPSKKEDKSAIWPFDIFGNDPSDDTQIAHLVPASYSVATLYRDVAIWTLGLREDAAWETTQMAIHGARHRNVDDNTNETGDGGTDPNATTPGSTRKVIRTGIKNFVPNKIRLAAKAPFLDNAPCVLIVPVLTLDEVKSWNGGDYRAIVMVEKWKNNSVEAICRAIGMQKKGLTATARQVETSRLLLEQVITGMAYSLFRRFPHTFTDNLNTEQRTKLDKLRNTFINLRGRGVVVPCVNRDRRGNAQPLRVRMVEFASSSSTTGHPAPDPLLLAVRAAVNWSIRHSQPLMAAAEPKDDDEDDRQAEEEFLEWREEELEREEQAWRNPSEEELARRLGQPNGYQEDEVNGAGGASPSTDNRPISPPEAPRPSKRWRLERNARGRKTTR